MINKLNKFDVRRSYVFDIQTIEDNRGSLGVLENCPNVPFVPERAYYLYNVPLNSKRGGHAHKELEQILFCITGSCRVVLSDIYGSEITVFLNSPKKGLYVPKMLWRELDQFKENTVFLCCASLKYDENDYIRSKSAFKNYLKND